MVMRRVFLFLALVFAAVSCNAATLYIEEYPAPQTWPGALVSAAVAPGVAKQTVAIGGTSTQSTAFVTCGTTYCLIRIETDSICSVEVGGTNPTATATSARMTANQTEYFLVSPGDKLAVITNT